MDEITLKVHPQGGSWWCNHEYFATKEAALAYAEGYKTAWQDCFNCLKEQRPVKIIIEDIALIEYGEED
jgi:hypothetical protein